MNITSFFSDWRVLAAVTVLSWGSYNVVLKAIAKDVSWQLSMFYFVIGYALTVSIFCLANMSSIKTSIFSPVYILSLSAGLLCGLGAITFFKALPEAPGSILMPLIGLYVLISAIGCLIFLKEPISLRVISGIICAIIAIVLLSK